MMFQLSMAALLVPLVLLLLNSNIFPGEHMSERSTAVTQNRTQNSMSGHWTMDIPAGAQKARLVLHQAGNDDDWASFHVPVAQLQGLNSAAATSGAARTTFQLTRNAGTFSFTGSFQNGRGSGDWTFKASSTFVTELRKHGYEQLSADAVYKLALNDLNTTYIAELAQAGYRNLTVDELISLYSNNVRGAYIASLASVGYSKLSPRDLVALKTNGVTDAYIKSLQNRGHKDLSVQRILSLRTNPGNQQ
jgi:hypothetical protein